MVGKKRPNPKHLNVANTDKNNEEELCYSQRRRGFNKEK